MIRPSQRAVLEALIADPTRPVLERFDGAIFDPAAVLQEVRLANLGNAPCFSTDEYDDSEERDRIGPGRFRFHRYGWLKPVAPRILQIDPTSPRSLASLDGNNHGIVAAIAHVDPGFKVFHFRGTWWLQWIITDPEADDGPPVLVAPDYYLMRRVLAMEELHSIYEEDAMVEDEEDDETPEVFPLFVWGSGLLPHISN
jgi:hypothetical protein